MKKMDQSKLRQFISLCTLLVLVLVFTFTSQGFLTQNNIFSILRNAAIPGIISIGVTYVIVTGGIDLSTGSIVALSAMTVANLYHYTALPIIVVLLCGVIVGLLSGMFNGFVITTFGLPEFIATLATQGVFRGLTYITAIRVNGTISNLGIKDYRVTLLGGELFGVYFVTIAFFIMVIVGQVVLKRTEFGDAIYATGANRKAAELSGINTKKTRFLVFAITGFCAGVAALFTVGRMQTATTDFGVGLEFDVIAAVVVGGCALSGGYGDVVGSMIGAIFMAALDNGIYKYNLDTSYQLIIKGCIIILVVMFDSVYKKIMEKNIEKRKLSSVQLN